MPRSTDTNHVEDIEALRREIDMAVAAIAANKLQAFEESLRRQIEKAMRYEAALLRSAPPASEDARMRDALKRLRTSTDTYAQAVFHAGQSSEMLSALYRTRVAGDIYAGTERGGWSWQV